MIQNRCICIRITHLWFTNRSWSDTEFLWTGTLMKNEKQHTLFFSTVNICIKWEATRNHNNFSKFIHELSSYYFDIAWLVWCEFWATSFNWPCLNRTHKLAPHVTYILTTFSEYLFDYDRTCTLFNPLNPELNPICYLLALLLAHHFLHVSRIRVKRDTVECLDSTRWSVV